MRRAKDALANIVVISDTASVDGHEAAGGGHAERRREARLEAQPAVVLQLDEQRRGDPGEVVQAAEATVRRQREFYLTLGRKYALLALFQVQVRKYSGQL